MTTEQPRMTGAGMFPSTDRRDGHDNHCERDKPIGYSIPCGCDARFAVRASTAMFANNGMVSAELVEHGQVDIGQVLEDMTHRAMHNMLDAIKAAGRVPVLSTLHIVGEHNGIMDADELKLGVLTVPAGTSTTSRFVLEVADDWMRAQGLRR